MRYLEEKFASGWPAQRLGIDQIAYLARGVFPEASCAMTNWNERKSASGDESSALCEMRTDVFTVRIELCARRMTQISSKQLTIFAIGNIYEHVESGWAGRRGRNPTEATEASLAAGPQASRF